MRRFARYSPSKSSVTTGEGERPSAPTSVAASSTLKRYCDFLEERFPPKQFLLLSAVICLLAAFGTQAYLYGRPADGTAVGASFIAIFLLLLRLRLVDELKDLEHDRLYYPSRPIPRGLVRPPEVARAAATVFLLEILVAATGGIQSLAFFVIVALYSLLTLKEFFLRKWIRGHFTVYVVSHELMVLPVCFYLFSLNGLGLAEVMGAYFWLLAALIAGQLLLLEVTRKLRPKELEVKSRDTYTSQYGIANSCILAGLLALGVAATGILTASALGSQIAVLGYVGLAFFVPVAFSLVTFATRPDVGTAKAVLNGCAGLVLATSTLFSLTVWFVP